MVEETAEKHGSRENNLDVKETATLDVGGDQLELPVVVGSEGERAVDIGRLRSQSGYVTLDPAYVNTASAESAITFIDGEKGILRYRGYPIEELAQYSTFVETSYLLIHGEIPNEEDLTEFRYKLRHHSMILVSPSKRPQPRSSAWTLCGSWPSCWSWAAEWNLCRVPFPV